MTSAERGLAQRTERAWQRVEEHWADDAAHRHFIAFCAEQGALGEAGRRYREVVESDPARRAEAERRLGAVLGVAFSRLDAARTYAPVRRSRTYWLGCGMSIAALAYALLALLRLLAR